MNLTSEQQFVVESMHNGSTLSEFWNFTHTKVSYILSFKDSASTIALPIFTALYDAGFLQSNEYGDAMMREYTLTEAALLYLEQEKNQ